ncbi:MAG TPA: hypothetical protein VIL22_08805 [Paenibacillaceae bacterium]
MSRFMMMSGNFGQVFYFYFSILGNLTKGKNPLHLVQPGGRHSRGGCHPGRRLPGGFSEWMKVAHTASGWDVPLIPHFFRTPGGLSKRPAPFMINKWNNNVVNFQGKAD